MARVNPTRPGTYRHCVDTYGANGGPTEELTALLAGHPTSIARLLDEHIDDGSGR
jgi:hypothetical protein